jgi:hypothetical protein
MQEDQPVKIETFEEQHLFQLISKVYRWLLLPSKTRGDLKFKWNDRSFELPAGYDKESIAVNCSMSSGCSMDQAEQLILEYRVIKRDRAICGMVQTLDGQTFQMIDPEFVDVFMEIFHPPSREL